MKPSKQLGRWALVGTVGQSEAELEAAIQLHSSHLFLPLWEPELGSWGAILLTPIHAVSAQQSPQPLYPILWLPASNPSSNQRPSWVPETVPDHQPRARLPFEQRAGLVGRPGPFLTLNTAPSTPRWAPESQARESLASTSPSPELQAQCLIRPLGRKTTSKQGLGEQAGVGLGFFLFVFEPSYSRA